MDPAPFASRSSNEYEWEETALLAPYNYIAETPGKHIRSKLAKAFNQWLNIDEDRLRRVAEIIEMLHNASLMIDDIEDSSVLRRGQPVAHSIYGVPRTINTANYAYFIALQKCLALGDTQTMSIFTERMLDLHRGQGMELFWRDTVHCPTEEEYTLMVKQKTGGLFGLAVDLMQLFSHNKENYKPLIDLLGLLFQIRDDYANLCSRDYADKKTYAEDLSEGKFSFPIIYALQKHPEDTKLLNIVRQKTSCNEVKKYCVNLLHEMGAFEYTKTILLRLDGAIVAELRRLGGNDGITAVLEELRECYTTSG